MGVGWFLGEHEVEESIEHSVFHWLAVFSLCELIEVYMVCMLHGHFVLETSSVCNVVVSVISSHLKIEIFVPRKDQVSDFSKRLSLLLLTKSV